MPDLGTGQASGEAPLTRTAERPDSPGPPNVETAEHVDHPTRRSPNTSITEHSDHRRGAPFWTL
jgi:hypothetical protein